MAQQTTGDKKGANMPRQPHNISTSELDGIARLGLDDLRAALSSNPPAGAIDRAEICLKVLRQGTSRMSAENNRLATALKIAKSAGVPPNDQKLLWNQIASGEAPSE